MIWNLKSSPLSFLQWYSNNTADIFDRICCCSYLDAQVYGEAASHDYYNTRSTTIPTEFIIDDIPMEASRGSTPKLTRPSTDLTWNRPPSPTSISPTSSFGSMTTVSIHSNLNSYDSQSTRQTSNIANDHGENYRIYPSHSYCETELTMGSGSNIGSSCPPCHKKRTKRGNPRQDPPPQVELMTHAKPSAFQDISNVYLESRQPRPCRREYSMEMIHQVQTEGLAKLPHLRDVQVGYRC